MDTPISFASVCPQCWQQQPQRDYCRSALLNLFNSDQPIEAYCVTCDKSWPISPEERICIAEALAAPGAAASPPSGAESPLHSGPNE